MIRRSSLALLFATAAAAGCAVAEGDGPVESRSFALGADESTLSSEVLDFANTADVATLRTAVSSSAASAIVAARPIASMAALASTSYVGDAALDGLLRAVAADDVAAGAGFWEETLLSVDQAAATLEMANVLELGTLGCDIGLTSTMAQRVTAARPLADVTALVDLPYFGAAQLRRFKDAVAWYRAGDATATRLDCVAFTADQRDAGLRFVNEAGYGQLCAVGGCGFGGWSAQVGIITAGRPWASLDAVAQSYGIGPASMGSIRRGADDVLGGLLLGPDSVRSVLAGEVLGEWVKLGPTELLEPAVDVGSVYVPGTGYRLAGCERIADAGDPEPATHSALHCVATCSPETRYWFHATLGLVFYTGTQCSFD